MSTLLLFYRLLNRKLVRANAVFAVPTLVDFLLIGTGRTHQFLPPALQEWLRSFKIGFESMTTVY